MNKKLSTGLKSLFIIIVTISMFCIFGIGSITKFVFKQVLFTPYNIVGIIMTIATICGGYINKREGHWLNLTLTILSGFVSLFSFVCTICSWFNINLLYLIWVNALKPAAMTFGTILLWIFIVTIGISLIGFMVYGSIKIVCYIKDEKKWKIDLKIYSSQKNLIENIAESNAKKSITSIQSTIKKEEHSKSPQQNNLTPTVTEKPKLKTNQNTKQINLPNDYELKISNNICPVCGWYLKKRINKKTNEQFRGCSNFAYHNCTFTISDDEYIKIYKKFH